MKTSSDHPEDESFWTLRLRDDLNICLPLDIQDHTTYILLEQEDWHDPALDLLKRITRPGLRVMEISAEYGLFGLRLARALDHTSQVSIRVASDEKRTLVQASANRNELSCQLDLQSGPFTSANQVPDCDLLILSASALSIETFTTEARALAAKTSLLVLHRLNEQPDPVAWAAVFDQIGFKTYWHLPGPNLLVSTALSDRSAIEPNTLFACTTEEATLLRDSGLLAEWPTDHEHLPATACTWQQAFSAFPFVASMLGEHMLLEVWKGADRTVDTHWPAYEQALNAYLSAMASGYAPIERLAWLLQSRNQLEELLQTGDGHPSTLFLQIRVLSDCGENKAALKLAQNLVRRLEKGANIEFDRPFLPPHARYDYSSPKQDIAAWLLASILEAAERLRGSSAWFSLEDPPRQFDRIPDAHPQMERRQYLHSFRYHGKLSIPDQSRLRTESSAEHRNGDWWCLWSIQDDVDDNRCFVKIESAAKTKITFSNDKVKSLQKKLGLSYHVPYLLRGEQEVGFSGMKVLEIGGNLPKELVIYELGAKQWVGIEDFSYWRELPVDGGGSRPENLPELRLPDVESDLSDYQILDGAIEELPESMENTFDRIFSIACFEHINKLGYALERMHAALKPGGLLFTMYSPIWSAYDGHHIPTVTDQKGQMFGFGRNKCPIPPWGHLLFTPPRMEKHLLAKTDHETVSKLIYHIYHSPHINRLFTEDYFDYFEQSSFEIIKMERTFLVQIPHDVKMTLKNRYPDKQYFENDGILAVLKKTF